MQWDRSKAAANLEKHGVDFADAATVLEDDFAITVEDEDHDEQRFVTIGADALGRVLVVVYTWRDDEPRLVSARGASPRERRQYEEGGPGVMKDEYDFSGGKRGAVLRPGAGKTRITIRIDDDVLEWFRKAAHQAGGASYQSMMNQALRDHVENATEEPLEDTLRRVLEEILPGARKRTPRTAKKKTASRSKKAAKRRSS